MRIELFNDDPETHAIVMIGEIGGNAEETAAAYIKSQVKKPVVGFIAGQTAPPGRRMGHAGAIISGGRHRQRQIRAMSAAGIRTVETPAELGSTVAADGEKRRLKVGRRESLNSKEEINCLPQERILNARSPSSSRTPPAAASPGGNTSPAYTRPVSPSSRSSSMRLTQAEAEGFYAVHRERGSFSASLPNS